jgi:nucleoside-diphosphate kinase
LGLLRLTTSQAEEFYEVHRGKPFFPDLVSFMCSGPTVVAALEGEDAVRRLRRVVGATDPSEAEPGTIRRQFGLDVQRNSVHASDSPSTAARELVFFFGSGAGDGSGEGALAGERTIV